MPQTALVVLAASQVIGGVQGYQAGKASAKEARLQGDAEYQAALSGEEQARTQADYERGDASAKVGSSGVTTAGSPLQIMAAQARQQELEALNIRYGGESARRAYQSKANIASKEAQSALFSNLAKAGQTAASAGGSGGSTNFLERPASKPWLNPDTNRFV